MEEAFHNLRRAVEFTFRGPLAEEIVRSKEAHILMMELPMVLDEMLDRSQMELQKPATKKHAATGH